MYYTVLYAIPHNAKCLSYIQYNPTNIPSHHVALIRISKVVLIILVLLLPLPLLLLRHFLRRVHLRAALPIFAVFAIIAAFVVVVAFTFGVGHFGGSENTRFVKDRQLYLGEFVALKCGAAVILCQFACQFAMTMWV